MPSEQPPTRVEKPRMALRPYHDDPERLDDVVVEDVAMFRAEMMDDGHLWMACYFDKSGTAPDLHFSVIAGKTGRAQLHLSATDVPPHIDIDAAPDEPAAPSEQPREGTRVNPDDVERAERWIGDAISRYYDHGCDDEADRDVMAMRRCIDALKARLEPAQPQPRGEGDDLAARLEEKSNVEEGLRPARPTNLPGPDLYHLGRAEAFAEAAQLARASTHQRKELLEMETQDAITIAYHRNNERGFRDALALTPRAERTTKDSQAAYDLGYEEGRKVRQSLVYNIQEAPTDGCLSRRERTNE